jgi:hypothetical protein
LGDPGVRRLRVGIEAHGRTRMVAFAFFAVATWRVTHLLVDEDGPADVVLRMRRRAGSSALGQVMDCFYCASLWVALPFAVELMREPSPNVPWWRGGTSRRMLSLESVATWCALSGAACLLERATEPGVTGAPFDEPIVPHQEWNVAADPRCLVVESVA